MALNLRGVFVAMITPFSAQGVDEPGLARLVDYLIERGASGLVPSASTGEFATLTHQEHRQVVEFTIKHVAGRVPVIAGAGSNCTSEAVGLAQHAEQAGAAGALVVAPYYNRPSQAMMIAHFTEVAKSTSLPIILYNIPKRTAVSIEASTVGELSHVPNIVGIKEASGDITLVGDMIAKAQPGFAMLSGDGVMTFSICCLGGVGAILADAHVLPGEWRRMVELIAEGKLAEARAIHYRLLGIGRALFLETNPVPLKAAMEMLGVTPDGLRLPLLPASENCRQVLRQELEQLGLL